MDGLKRWWKSVPTPVRKPLVLILGSILVITGIIGFALPLLPGWPLFFVGFAVLATEFAFAESVRDWLLVQVKKFTAWARNCWKNLRKHKQ